MELRVGSKRSWGSLITRLRMMRNPTMNLLWCPAIAATDVGITSFSKSPGAPCCCWSATPATRDEMIQLQLKISNGALYVDLIRCHNSKEMEEVKWEWHPWGSTGAQVLLIIKTVVWGVARGAICNVYIKIIFISIFRQAERKGLKFWPGTYSKLDVIMHLERPDRKGRHSLVTVQAFII